MKNAFISAEDKNFYTHHGYDARGIAVAAFEAVRSRGKTVRGASTITQQVMKNFLLSGDRTGERKIKEIILATRIEETLPKDKILELYLNEIFLGQNSYGVAAAAQTYFNKTLSQLTPAEAATLASMPQAPSQYHPVRAKERLTQRRNYVLREMFENGYIDEATLTSSLNEPLRSVQNGDYPAFREALPPRDYFTDEIRRQLSSEFGEQEFFGGGLTIRATIDRELQEEAAAALRVGLEKYDRNLGIWRGTRQTLPADKLGSEADWRAALAAARVPRDVPGWHPAVVLEVGDSAARIGIEGVEEDEDGHYIPAEDVTWARKRQADGKLGPKARRAGDLLAVGDVVLVREVTGEDGSFRRWSLRQVPEVQGAFMAMDVNSGRVLAMQGGFSYQYSVFNRATQATRQPGSSFKPFVYAAALDSGFTPATIVIDAPIEVQTAQGLWTPKNASGKYYGPTPLRTGVEQSRNLMTVRIAQEIGMDTVASYAERFGVYDRMGQFLANALGAEETTLFKMVAAYAMFANGGERVQPTLVDRVQDRFGRTIYRHDQRICDDCAQPLLPEGRAPHITLEARTGDGCDHRLSAHLDDGGRDQARHGAGDQPAGAGGGQDRHHERRQGRLVHRLYLEHRRGLLHRLRPAALDGLGLGRRLLRPGVPELHDEGREEIRRLRVPRAPGRLFHEDRPVHRRAPARRCDGRQCGGRVFPSGRGSGLRHGRLGRRRLCHGIEPAAVCLWRGRRPSRARPSPLPRASGRSFPRRPISARSVPAVSTDAAVLSQARPGLARSAPSRYHPRLNRSPA